MKRFSVLVSLSLAACVATPEIGSSVQEMAQFGDPDPTPTLCTNDAGCDDPRCEDLSYGCTVYAQYPDDAGCHVMAYSESGPSGPVIHCLCTGVVSQNTACVLMSFSS